MPDGGTRGKRRGRGKRIKGGGGGGEGATERKRITVAVDGKRDLGTEEEGDGRKGVRRHPIHATDAAFYTGGREGGRPSVVYFGYGPTDRRKKQKQ